MHDIPPFKLSSFFDLRETVPNRYPSFMSLQLYNTYSKKEETFTPLKPGEVTMYTCGPTVYGRPHIGNYSSFLMADLLRRWLEAGHGYKVKHVKNITDVGHLLHDADHGDDKIQKQAEKEKIHPLEIARRYTDMYLADEKELNMMEPFARPRASEYVKQMLAIIRTLLEKGNAYETEDGIYFSVESFKKYGMLSGNTLENLSAGSRIEVDEKKKHPADFALWKKTVGDNGRHVLRWNFSDGELSHSEGEDPKSGFPGWHIECSAMSSSLLGEQIDLHTGGEDNIFPHHECEIAQSECASGHQFVRLWLHKRRIDLGDAKMSKSLGNVLTLPDIASKGFSAADLRYYLLSVHYRTNLKFTERGLEDAHKARKKIVEWMQAVRSGETNGPMGTPLRPSGFEGQAWSNGEMVKFGEAMDSDLNTPAALASVFEVMNAYYRDGTTNKKEMSDFAALVANTFGCFEPEDANIPAKVLKLVEARKQARATKDFIESDRLRDQIKALGYEVRDSGGEQAVRKM